MDTYEHITPRAPEVSKSKLRGALLGTAALALAAAWGLYGWLVIEAVRA